MPGEADAVQNIKDLKASADAAAARASDLQAQYDKAAKGIKAPDTGTVPDVQPDPQEPSRVPLDEATAHGIRQFGLMSLAMMAISPRSAGASVEAATRFLAGAVNGLNQGNVERYKLEMDHWQNAISEAHAKNQEVMQRYNAVLRSKMIPFETKLKELSVIATQAHDATTAAMLAQGRVSQAFDHLQTQQMGWSRLLQAGDGIKARADAHADNLAERKRHDKIIEAATGTAGKVGPTPGDMSLTGDKYLASLPPGMSDIVKAMNDGRMPFPSSFAMRYPYWQSVIQALAHFDPKSLNVSKYTVRLAMQKDFTSGKAATNITAINTAIAHMGTLESLATAEQNGDVATVNKIVNATKTEFGDPSINNAATASHAVASELMRVFRVVGASDQGVADFAEKLDVNKGPAVIKGAIKTGAKLLDGRINALQDQWKRGMQTETPFPDLLSPQSAATLEHLGVHPYGAPSVGRAAAPRVGEVEGGYRYIGGDPAQKASWQKQ